MADKCNDYGTWPMVFDYIGRENVFSIKKWIMHDLWASLCATLRLDWFSFKLSPRTMFLLCSNHEHSDTPSLLAYHIAAVFLNGMLIHAAIFHAPSTSNSQPRLRRLHHLHHFIDLSVLEESSITITTSVWTPMRDSSCYYSEHPTITKSLRRV